MERRDILIVVIGLVIAAAIRGAVYLVNDVLAPDDLNDPLVRQKLQQAK